MKLRSTVTLFGSQNYQMFGFLGLEADTGNFRPMLDDAKRDAQISIDEWWHREPILRALKQPDVFVTREELVLQAANKDGGSHVDVPSANYLMLSDGFNLSAEVGDTSGARWIVKSIDAHFAALRQIAHEVLTSRELLALVPFAEAT